MVAALAGSLPVRERGLKSKYENLATGSSASLPVRERGFKCQGLDIQLNGQRRYQCGSGDLNRISRLCLLAV